MAMDRPGFSRISVFIVHLVTFCVQSTGLYYDLYFVKPFGARQTYGGRWKYMTFICMIIQTVYFGYSLLNDVFGSNLSPHLQQGHRSRLQKLRDVFFASVAFPLGVFVVLTFWGIYAVDRELVFPKALDGVIPAWLNHVMHTTVLPFLLVEKLIVYHHYPSRSKGIGLTVLLGLTYMLWVFWIAYYAGIWVYPVLQVLSWPGRLLFLGGLWIFMACIYIIGEKLNHALWLPKKSTVQPSKGLYDAKIR